MNNILSILVDLQNIDSIIIEKNRIIEELPLKLGSFQKPIKEAEAMLKREAETLQVQERKKREKEIEIEDAKERIRKLRQKSADIKNNKEYQAMLKEIDVLERAILRLENDILDIMQDIEDIRNRVLSGEQKFAAENRILKAEQDRIDREIEQINLEIVSLKKERVTLVNKLDEDTYQWYMDILKRTRGLAVVEARNEICKGCNLHIPPQLFVELKKGGEILNCPQCRRILYYRGESKHDADTSE